MKTRIATAALTVVAALIVATGAPVSAQNGGRPFRVELSGANEVPPTPGGNADRATIVLRVNLGQGRICWVLEEVVRGSGGARPSHGGIHRAPAGATGPVVLPLFGHGDTPQSYPTAERCIENVDRAVIKDMLRNPQNYYIHLDNHQYGGRFVRGQLSR